MAPIKPRLWFSTPPQPQAQPQSIYVRCIHEKAQPIKLNYGLCPICHYDGPTVVYVADPYPMTVYHHKRPSSVPFWC